MKIRRSLLAVLVLLSAFAVNASGKDRVLNKARKAVESNFDNNWKVFAQSASMVIERGVGLEEAKAWLETSLDIQKTPYNLEVMGDYFFETGDKKSAVKYYYESLVMLKASSLDPDTQALQAKIWKSR